MFKIPAPVLPAANVPVASSSAHALAVADPAAPPAVVVSPSAAALAGSMPPALSNTQIQAVPALARIASAGAQIYDLGESHGIEAVSARSGSHFQVFYITPDGQAEIGGIMWDGRQGSDAECGTRYSRWCCRP